MRESIEEGREATSLLEYSTDFDEPTGRHEVTVNLHGSTSTKPSSNVDVTMTVAKRLPPLVLAAVVLGVAAIAACAWVVVHLAAH